MFQKGDKVEMDFWGDSEMGEVIRIDSQKDEPVVVKLKSGATFTFTQDGKFDKHLPNRNLTSIKKV